jgi:2-oxoglutarate/2-oxoacid ferredoxin oxidoreductase subunit alpha
MSETPRYGDPVLLKGNEAVCEGAIWAGCRYFFGYPITPQNQIPEYMSRRLPEVGGVFLQGESELASINMVYGAAAAGARAMTTSSSPGISLMMEGLSYLTGAELPCVVVNMSRGGPGLGNIGPAQSDYFQATRIGHGDMRMPVLVPWSVQEVYDFAAWAFDIADRLRSPVMVLADAVLGQMMESMRPRIDEPSPPPPKPWATTGAKGRERNIINSLYTTHDELEEVNQRIVARYDAVAPNILRWEETLTDDAEAILVAYGTSARVSRSALDRLRAKGIRAGLFRPITAKPFPYDRLRELSESARLVTAVEMSLGQMIEDVQLAVGDRAPVSFVGRTGGNIPSVTEVVTAIEQELAQKGGGAK